jgi:hypothetical protein
MAKIHGMAVDKAAVDDQGRPALALVLVTAGAE